MTDTLFVEAEAFVSDEAKTMALIARIKDQNGESVKGLTVDNFKIYGLPFPTTVAIVDVTECSTSPTLPGPTGQVPWQFAGGTYSILLKWPAAPQGSAQLVLALLAWKNGEPKWGTWGSTAAAASLASGLPADGQTLVTVGRGLS